MFALHGTTQSVSSGLSPHLIGLSIVVLITAGVLLLGHYAQRRFISARRFEHIAGSAALGLWIVIAIWYLLPRNFDPARSLPLHVCDLTGLIAPIAVLYSIRPTRAVLFFWSFALCTQALVTPTTGARPDEIEFWCFWLLHAQILALASFDLFIRGYRPNWRDFRFVVSAGAVYVALMIPVNQVIDANYGFVGRHLASRATILTYLGPWPWRILSVCVVAFGAHLVVMSMARCLPDPQRLLAPTAAVR